MTARITIPPQVQALLRQLNAAGFSAYAVGGCVRDSLLGCAPQDWDICTSAAPEQTEACFAADRTILTGARYGTVTVVRGGVPYEITTFRAEAGYADSRHPDRVDFLRELAPDLARRDFTVNAMAADAAGAVTDLFGGQDDLRRGVIRCVGDPAARFSEDALRMLRCVRFSAQLGFAIDPETWAALCANTALIQKISAERIREELQKLWLAPFANKMPLLWESGLLAQIDATLSASLIANSQTLLEEISLCPKDNILRWCIVLQHYPIGEVKGFLKGMRLDNHSLKRISLLLEELSADLPTEPYPLRKKLSTIGQEATEQLLLLQSILRPTSPHAETKATLEKILAAGDCLSLKTLALAGQDLMALGAPHGKILGTILAELLDIVLHAPEKNTKETLTALALALLEEL
mgnify:CR=1 FL=1